MMMTFGISTPVDYLSWVVAIALGLKVLATVLLLAVGREVGDRPGWGAALWWATKITPFVAVPGVICIAWMQRSQEDMWIFVALMVFVVVAVPWKVRQRRARIAKRLSATGLGT